MCEPGIEEKMLVSCIRREPTAVMEKWRGRIVAIMAVVYEKAARHARGMPGEHKTRSK